MKERQQTVSGRLQRSKEVKGKGWYIMLEKNLLICGENLKGLDEMKPTKKGKSKIRRQDFI